MPRIIKDVTISNAQGLHARPAAMFVQIASKYNSQVTIEKNKERINGKSIMGILTLGAQKGSVLTIEVNGEDAEALMAELETLLTRDETKHE